MQNQKLIQLSQLPSPPSDDTKNKAIDEDYLNNAHGPKNQQKTPGNQSYVNAPQNDYDSANVAYSNASLQSAPNKQKMSDGNDIYLEVDDDGPRSIRKPGPHVGMFYYSAAAACSIVSVNFCTHLNNIRCIVIEIIIKQQLSNKIVK